MRITQEMKVCDVLEMDPKLENIFLAHGMNCVGCPGGNCETIEEAAAGHDADLTELLEDINSALTK